MQFENIEIPIDGTQSGRVSSKKHQKQKLSIQTLIQEFKTVVLDKNELEYRDNPIRTEVLSLLFNQHSTLDVAKIFQDS